MRIIREKIPLLLSLVVSLGVLVSASSTLLTEISPLAALKVNPFNSQARFEYLESRMRSPEVTGNLDELLLVSGEGVALNPFESRMYSLHATLIEAQGKPEEAQIYYKHALNLVPTEQIALLRRFSYEFSNQDFLAAIKLADLIYHRWKPNWHLIEPFLPVLLRDEPAYIFARNRFPERPTAAIALIKTLSENPEGVSLARRLVLDWREKNLDRYPTMLNLALNGLIREDRYSDAYGLFYQTLPGDHRRYVGYVFNSRFDLPISRNPFNWNIRKQSGVSISRKKTDDPAAGNFSLEIRFHDQPSKFSGVWQYLRLPPGRFKLRVDYSNTDLRGPKPIKAVTKCRPTGVILAEMELSREQDSFVTKEAGFTVPEKECDFQMVWLYNDNFSKSWANRYSGSLTIHSISAHFIGD